MKELELNFKGRGEVKNYTFNQIKSTDLGFIYEKISDETNKISYEVFKRKENNHFGCVSYPTSKAFGKWAWEVNDLDKANNILENFKKIDNGRG